MLSLQFDVNKWERSDQHAWSNPDNYVIHYNIADNHVQSDLKVCFILN